MHLYYIEYALKITVMLVSELSDISFAKDDFIFLKLIMYFFHTKSVLSSESIVS